MAAPQEAATLVVHHKPLLIIWKKVRTTDFDGAGDPLIAQGWFKTTETIMESIELSDNQKVKCASYNLMMVARIWWETLQLKYDVNQMMWAQFTKEFNERFFNATIMDECWDQLNSLQRGTITITELMNKYRWLLRLCPEVATNEREKRSDDW